MVKHDLIKDKVFVVVLLQRVEFEVKVEGTHWVAGWLIIWEMKLAHVGVL